MSYGFRHIQDVAFTLDDFQVRETFRRMSKEFRKCLTLAESMLQSTRARSYTEECHEKALHAR